MPLWSCDVSDCGNPAVRGGHCPFCERRFCIVHFQAGSHTCTTEPLENYGKRSAAEISALMSRIDLQALILRASSLRFGMRCEAPPQSPEAPYMFGGRHYHFSIVFEDGVTWIVRIPRNNASSFPTAHLNLIMLSEVATLRFLSTTKVPVPTVHDFAVEGPGNAIGVSYILMDRVHGCPLDFTQATLEQQRWVLNQFADTFIELEKYPFHSIGSLCDPKTNNIGSCTSDGTADMDDQGKLRSFGPFADNMSYLTAKVKLTLEQINRREEYPKRPVDAYLVHRYLGDMLLHSKRPEDNSRGPFYLKHMDDKGDHILVDDDFNITAILDWEWAQTVSKADAFCSPLFLLDVASFYDGENALSKHEAMFAEILQNRGKHDLANLILNSRLQHRLNFALCGSIDRDDFKQIFEGFLKLQPERKNKSVSWDDWKAESLAKYADEPDLVRLIEEEKAMAKMV